MGVNLKTAKALGRPPVGGQQPATLDLALQEDGSEAELDRLGTGGVVEC